MLTGIAADGLAPAMPDTPGDCGGDEEPDGEGADGACPHQSLARDPRFRCAVLAAAAKALRAGACSAEAQAVRAGVVRDGDLQRLARRVLAVPDWRGLAGPAANVIHLLVRMGACW